MTGKKRKNQPGYVEDIDSRGHKYWKPEGSAAASSRSDDLDITPSSSINDEYEEALAESAEFHGIDLEMYRLMEKDAIDSGFDSYDHYDECKEYAEKDFVEGDANGKFSEYIIQEAKNQGLEGDEGTLKSLYHEYTWNDTSGSESSSYAMLEDFSEMESMGTIKFNTDGEVTEIPDDYPKKGSHQKLISDFSQWVLNR